MDHDRVVDAFNEWMRRYTEDPSGYEAEFQTVCRFLAERADGREITYGEQCAAYLEQLAAEPVG